MTNLITLADNRVNTIVGLGLTGYSCARYLHKNGIAFRVLDSREEPALKQQFVQEFPQIELHCGEFTATTFSANERIILSPGVAKGTPAISKALEQGAELSSDIALFLQSIDKPVVAVTGSNGKSTVVSLLEALLNAAGLQAVAAGNIGLPVLDLLSQEQQHDIYILELSSFQLESLDSAEFAAASILNISDDHLDRYDSKADYIQAKQNIYSRAAIAVVNREDTLTQPKVHAARTISFGLDQAEGEHFGIIELEGKAYLAQGNKALIACDELKIIGQHNQLNALAALAFCYALNIDLEKILPALKSFAGLPHRCQWLANIKDVDFYNDSKATNVGSVIAALDGLYSGSKDIVLIAGGVDKDSNFSELVDAVKRSVKKVVLIGQDAEKIARNLPAESYEYASTMEAAVKQAFNHAGAGDKVILAPACASFDMFKDYQHRGDVFVAAVRDLAQEVNSCA